MGFTVPKSSTAAAFLMLLLLVAPTFLQFPAAAAAAAAAVPGFDSAWVPSMTCDYDAAVTGDAVVRYPCRDIVVAMVGATPHIQRYLGLTDSQLQNKYQSVNLTVRPRLAVTNFAGQATRNQIELNAEIMMREGKRCEHEEKIFLGSLVYHEMTHVWQGGLHNRFTPGGHAFIEGIASFTADAAGYRRPEECKLPGRNPINVTEWHEAYCTTTDFLSFLSIKYPCIVTNLTSTMQIEIYHDGLFQNLTGKSPGDAWTEYVMEYRFGRFRPPSPFDDPCHPYPISQK